MLLYISLGTFAYWFTQREPHPCINVWRIMLLNIEENWALFISGLASGRQLAEPAYPAAIQLSVKESSCAVLDCTEGPLFAPAYRGTTVTATEAPPAGTASSHSPMLHTCGEFQANKFKGRVIHSEKRSGVCKCPPGIVSWSSMLLALWHALPTGTRCHLYKLMVTVLHVLLEPRSLFFRGAYRLRLMTGWFMSPGAGQGVDWNNHCLRFHCPLFHWSFVWRVLGYCMHGSQKPWIYRLDLKHLPIIKPGTGDDGLRIKCHKWLGLGWTTCMFPSTPPVTALALVSISSREWKSALPVQPLSWQTQTDRISLLQPCDYSVWTGANDKNEPFSEHGWLCSIPVCSSS